MSATPHFPQYAEWIYVPGNAYFEFLYINPLCEPHNGFCCHTVYWEDYRSERKWMGEAIYNLCASDNAPLPGHFEIEYRKWIDELKRTKRHVGDITGNTSQRIVSKGG